jgi:hypothetical protein
MHHCLSVYNWRGNVVFCYHPKTRHCEERSNLYTIQSELLGVELAWPTCLCRDCFSAYGGSQ